MDKLRMESPDMTAQNIDRIAALFPNCITEMLDEEHSTPEKKVYKRAVNFELLKQMLSPDVVDGDEAYEFTWVGKKAAIMGAFSPSRKTLRPYKEKSVDWNTTNNLYIEGDNLEVLKLLQEGYLNAIDVIYIDPPYNTGSNLIYQNNFFQSEDDYSKETGLLDDEGNRLFVNTENNGRFHSDWCSMIYARLLLARNMLKKTGVLVCAIDQSEINTLGLMLSEIFSDKEITLVSIVHNPSGTQGENFSHNNEYVYFVYDGSKRSIALETRSEENADIRSFMNGAKGSAGSYLRTTGYRSFFPIIVKDKKIIGFGEPVEKDVHPSDSNIQLPNGIMEIYPIDGEGVERKWLFSRDTVESVKDELQIKYNSRRNRYEIIRVKNRINYKTIWTDKKYNAKQYGTMLLNDLLDSPFTFPKSLYAVEECLIAGLNDNKDGVVLDFFSGSATTAHAVMLMNAKDGGKRQFIMVQLPESIENNQQYKTICDIGEERIRRAGEKIKSESPMTTQDLDVGFRVLKLDDTNMKDIYYAPDDYDQGMLAGLESNIKDDRTDLDLLFGCLIDWGLPLSLPYKSEKIDGCTVHTYNDGDLIACFDTNIPESVVKEIAQRKPLRAVFRDSGFASSPEKINVFEIFKLYMPEDANDISKRVKVI